MCQIGARSETQQSPQATAELTFDNQDVDVEVDPSIVPQRFQSQYIRLVSEMLDRIAIDLDDIPLLDHLEPGRPALSHSLLPLLPEPSAGLVDVVKVNDLRVEYLERRSEAEVLDESEGLAAESGREAVDVVQVGRDLALGSG